MEITPGTWIFHPEERYPGSEIMEPDHWEPPMVTIGSETIALMNAADARLIAAAPELLEACKAALSYMRSVGAMLDPNAVHEWDAVVDAIAKAEGAS